MLTTATFVEASESSVRIASGRQEPWMPRRRVAAARMHARFRNNPDAQALGLPERSDRTDWANRFREPIRVA